MKILVISDSHGLTDELFQVLNSHQKDVDAIIHCGDSELPKSSFSALKNLFIVGGNCDYDRKYADELIVEDFGVTTFVTHGHLYNVKSSLVKLSYRAEEVQAQLVCYGHSHLAVSFQENGVIYVNPGSFRIPRKRIERTYAIVSYEQEDATVFYYDHLGNCLVDLKFNFKLV